MFVAWGVEQTLLYNDAYATILANKHSNALGRPFMQVWSEIEADLIPIVEQAYAGLPVHMDDITLMMNRRGYVEETHFAFSYTPARGKDGIVQGLFCACTEITEQVLAERLRAADTERQRRLFEQAPGFITILRGPEHVFEFANATFRRLFGEREFVGKTVREAFPELAGQGFYELLDRVYQSGERFVADHVPILLYPSGSQPVERVLDFIYEPVVDETGTVTGIFVEGHDATDAHRAATELRESEERNRRIVEGVKDHSIFTVDDRNRVLDWTPGAEAVFGWSAEEIQGRSADILFTPEDREAGVPAEELATARQKGARMTSAGTCAATGAASSRTGPFAPSTTPKVQLPDSSRLPVTRQSAGLSRRHSVTPNSASDWPLRPQTTRYGTGTSPQTTFNGMKR
nr:PAS domain-containing protein [Sphingomonas xinjiangensis]